MKKIFYALFAAAFAMSCSEATVDEGAIQPEVGQGTPIEFYAEGSADSRTTYFEGDGLSVYWEEGDLVPIIVRGYYDKEGVQTETRNRGQYIAESSGASTKLVHNNSDELAWDFTLKNTNKTITEQPVDFVSFYCNPYSSMTTIYAGIGVYSDYNQEQAAANDYSHIGNYMVMASNIVHREAGDTTPVTFKYTNVMSIVELTLKGDAAKKVTAVELTSASSALGFTQGTLFVEDATKTTDVVEEPYSIDPVADLSSNTVRLQLTEYAPLSSEGTKFYMVVCPGEHTSGDITLTVHCSDGTYSTVKMGAINFERNKVYKPSVTLVNYEQKQAADITHLFTDDANGRYEAPVVFEDGALVITNRTNYPIWNVPAYMQTYQSATINATTYPTLNSITANNDGYVYVMVGTTTDYYENSHVNMIKEGWMMVTPRTSSGDKDLENYKDGQVFYGSDNTTPVGTWTIYERYMKAGETYDLTVLYAFYTKFQGIRPIAKTITNSVATQKILTFDFNSLPTGWTAYKNFNSILLNVIQGKKAYQMSDTEFYDLDFSYTLHTAVDANGNPTDGGGSGYHSSKYLLVNLSYTDAQSVGFPALEGYKLVEVQATTHSSCNAATVGISSVPAPETAVYVSTPATIKFEKSTVATYSWTIENSTANTPYYLYVGPKGQHGRFTELKAIYDQTK